jgi:hypothetical protein
MVWHEYLKWTSLEIAGNFILVQQPVVGQHSFTFQTPLINQHIFNVLALLVMKIGVYRYDVKTKAQSSRWVSKTSPRPQRARQVLSKVKVVLTVFFFYCEGVIHHEFLLRGQTVNEECYLKVTKTLIEAVRRKRPDLWREKNGCSIVTTLRCIPPYRSVHFLTQHEMTLVPQPAYSPDLTPTDFFLYTQLKSLLKGRRFESVQEIKGNSLEDLRNIPQEAFQECLQNWKKRWEQCLKIGEEYVTGDKAQ